MTAAVTDFTQYSTLRAQAQANDRDPELLRSVAGQFEALFIQTLLETMRESSIGDPIFGNDSSHDTYVEMLDQQLSVELSRQKGMGISDILVRQLGGAEPAVPKAKPDLAAGTVIPAQPTARRATEHPGVEHGDLSVVTEPSRPGRWEEPGEFVRDIWPHAERTADRLGVETRSIVAQAALETGWGRHVMSKRDGSSSFNLFGIKASQGWGGGAVNKPTVEYKDGLASREVAHFRTYDTLEEAFEDYAAFLSGRPRYAEALGSGADRAQFAQALQDAGYATDPDYATKIQRIVDSETMKSAVADLKSPGTLPTYSLAARYSAP